MSSATLVLLSSVLTFGVPLLLAIRELVVLRPTPPRGDGPPPPRVEPITPKPLPDCLRPVPINGRSPVCVLEYA